MSDHSGFFMARQPIYSRDMRLAGYELLYRGGGSASSCEIDDAAEIGALANILVEVGLDKLVGKEIAFVNVPARLLGTDALRLLPSDRVTIEILEDTPWTPEVAADIAHLKDLNYRLAFDDYIFEPKHAPFLREVDIVKVDIMGTPHEVLKTRFPQLRRPGQVYLAEKVETHEELDMCMKLGFDLFQGYFFAKPNTIKGTGVPANYSASLSLLSRMQDPDITLDELDTLMATNLPLCHKVLRLVNSASIGLARPVDSIKQALLFLGLHRVRTLASLALMTSIPGKPPELYSLAMVRARFCEEAARKVGFETPDKHFTVGLLSILDAITDLPMDEIISELPLSKELVETLCGKSEDSPCAKTLQTVIALEHGDFRQKEDMASLPSNTYLDAVDWVRNMENALAA